MTDDSEMDRKQAELKVQLMGLKLRHMRSVVSMGSTAVIALRAEMIDDPDLNLHFSNLRSQLVTYGRSVDQHFAALMLMFMVAEIELYLSDAVKAILTVYPKKLAQAQFKLSEIIDRPQDEIIQMAAERHLYSLMYKKPKEYLAELCEIMSIDAKLIQPLWGSFVEAKARRDLGSHNDWRVNETYLRKTAEIGIAPNAVIGQDICPDHEYNQGLTPKFSGLVDAFSDQLEQRFSGIAGKAQRIIQAEATSRLGLIQVLLRTPLAGDL